MITHTSDSHQFPCQNKTNFEILQETLHATHLLKLLDKMYKYEMDLTRTVGATERTRDAGRTDGRTDGQTDGRTLAVSEASLRLPTLAWDLSYVGFSDGKARWANMGPTWGRQDPDGPHFGPMNLAI